MSYINQVTFKVRKEAFEMFNSVNNPFGKRITSSTSSDTNGRQEQRREQPEKEKRLIDEEEQDEVKIGGLPLLTEDDIIYMVKTYISNIKSEHEGDTKIQQKADKWLEKFDVKKFMKKNPTLTSSDFYMVMFIETESITK